MGLKRWLVGTRPRSSTAKPVGLSQHQTQHSVLDLLQPQSVSQLRIPEAKGKKSRDNWNLPSTPQQSQKIIKEEDDQRDEFSGAVFPTPSELLDFPPPFPRVIRKKDSESWNDKHNQRSKGKRVERKEKNVNSTVEGQAHAGNMLPKRTARRSKLNERTFTMTPRYSSPQSPASTSRPLSRVHPSSSFNDTPSLPPTLVGFSSDIRISNSSHVVKPNSLHSSPEAPTMSTPSHPGLSRLSNPLPLPPGWTFQPDSAIPARGSSLKLARTPSYRDSLRASRPLNRADSNKRSPRHHHRRPPSPRPPSIRDQRSKHNHYPRRSWSSSPSVRNKDPRTASFSSLGSILGGNSSESDSSSDASSSSVVIEVVVEPRSNLSQLSLASWPYSPPPPPASSQGNPPS